MTPKPPEEEVRKRAKQLWEEHGKPEGRDDEFWQTAETRAARCARSQR